MMKAIMSLFMLAAMVAFSISPAAADDDGVTFLAGDPVPGVSVDVTPGSIDRDELSAGVQEELDTAAETNDTQDAHISDHAETLALHTTELAAASSSLVLHDDRLGSLETVAVNHGQQISTHAALLSEHTATLTGHGKRLDQHARGLAIAMAMPDAFLSDKERFSIAGGFGSFDGETAFGAVFMARIDANFAAYAGAGTDAQARTFGFKAGVRAGF